MPKIDLKSKFRGCVLGAACGDALGYPVEFMSADVIHHVFGPRGIRELEVSPRAGGVALFSDDTQMSEAVMRGLLDAGRGANVDRAGAKVGERCVAWSADPPGGHRAPGSACMAGCRRMAEGVHWARAGGPNAGGCGSVMRSHPYGLWHWDDPAAAATWAAAHSGMTHGAPLALGASAAQAAGVVFALREASPNVVAHVMIDAARRYDGVTANMLSQAIDYAADPAVTAAEVLATWRGWAGHEALAAALFCFLRYPDDFLECVALGANSPGDSDSIASIAGALSGARLGVGAIPERWLKILERCCDLTELADAVCAAATSGTDVLYVMR